MVFTELIESIGAKRLDMSPCLLLHDRFDQIPSWLKWSTNKSSFHWRTRGSTRSLSLSFDKNTNCQSWEGITLQSRSRNVSANEVGFAASNRFIWAQVVISWDRTAREQTVSLHMTLYLSPSLLFLFREQRRRSKQRSFESTFLSLTEHLEKRRR